MALSRRLRVALLTLYRDRWAPSPGAHVLESLDPSNFAKPGWRRVLERARVGHVRPKDLRHTYASQLLTAGVQLGWNSRQLGHADGAVTARHYARWGGDDAYREPLQLAEGKVPPDLLARLAEATHAAASVVRDAPLE